MRPRIALIAALASAVLGAQDSALPPDLLFLSKAVRHIRDGMRALPNYTCVETIARDTKPAQSAAFKRIDLVRLEVAKTGTRELFGWPGARSLEDRPITDFVAGGLVGNGVFSTYAEDLFVHSSGTMHVVGPEVRDGRTVTRVDYSFHTMNGTLTLTTMSGRASVNWSGSFWVDPRTLDLIRLDVNGDEIPEALQLSSAHIGIEYGVTDGAILPQSAVIELTKTSGEVSRNRIDFAACRKFTGEAQLIFDTDESAPAETGPTTPKALPRTLTLPADLTIPLRLEREIDVRSAGVGDALTAVVDREVRDKSRLWLPKGAIVSGRIRRVESRNGYRLAAVEFFEAQVGKDRFEFAARLDAIDPTQGVDINNSSRQSRDMTHVGPVTQTSVRQYFDLEIPGAGYFYLTDSTYRIPAGMRMTWKTEALRGK